MTLSAGESEKASTANAPFLPGTATPCWPNGTNQPAREYVYYPGTFEPLAAIDGDGSIYYYHNDPNGLPQELTRPNGEIVWSAIYDALGRVDQILVDEVAQPLRMQGQYYDPEIDLCYNRYRYFDPQICSFISQDPLGLAAGENVYAYAPNVWGWVDPLGLSCKMSGKKGGFSTPDGASKGARHAPTEYTKPGEKFVRVGNKPENLKFTFENPGGTQKGTYAFPEETFNKIGKDPVKLKDLGDLPGAEPNYYRILEPPAGTPIQRGTVLGGEFGGSGGVPEVIFPEGF